MKRVHLLAGTLGVLLASYATGAIDPIGHPPALNADPLTVNSLTVTNAASVGGALTAVGPFTVSPGSMTVRVGANQVFGVYSVGGILRTGSLNDIQNANAPWYVDGNPLALNTGGGSVGIGTASPGTKLHMSSGTLTVDGDTPGGATPLVITNGSGNSNRGSQAKLGSDLYLNNYGGAGYLSGQAQLSSAGAWTARGTTQATIGVNESNSVVITADSGLTSGNTYTPTPRVTFGPLGQVTLSTMTSTYVGGAAHVCVTNAGLLYASEAACP